MIICTRVYGLLTCSFLQVNQVTGVFDALCTVDIGGAIAYMSQVGCLGLDL